MTIAAKLLEVLAKPRKPAETGEKLSLLDAVNEVREQRRLANIAFENAGTPELVEASVYEIKALEVRYAYLLRLARENGAASSAYLKTPK